MAFPSSARVCLRARTCPGWAVELQEARVSSMCHSPPSTLTPRAHTPVDFGVCFSVCVCLCVVLTCVTLHTAIAPFESWPHPCITWTKSVQFLFLVLPGVLTPYVASFYNLFSHFLPSMYVHQHITSCVVYIWALICVCVCVLLHLLWDFEDQILTR